MRSGREVAFGAGLVVEEWLWLRGRHFRGRGRKSKLSAEQKAQVREWVEQGPQKSGFDQLFPHEK